MAQIVTLFDARTTDGNSSSTAIHRHPSFNKAIQPTAYFSGTFDGATGKIQASPDDSTWFDTGVSATVAGAHAVEIIAPYYRANIAGAGASTELDAVMTFF